MKQAGYANGNLDYIMLQNHCKFNQDRFYLVHIPHIHVLCDKHHRVLTLNVHNDGIILVLSIICHRNNDIIKRSQGGGGGLKKASGILGTYLKSEINDFRLLFIHFAYCTYFSILTSLWA